jgi:hypothetical protein
MIERMIKEEEKAAGEVEGEEININGDDEEKTGR